MKKSLYLSLFALTNLFLIVLSNRPMMAADGAFTYRLPIRPYGIDLQAVTVVGAPCTYTVQKEDTLLDIARNFDLGFSEIQLLYKDIDPWVPPEGLELIIPTFWVLPEGKWDGIVINIPEMRLYLFFKKISMVKTFPIGIGVTENFTPVGRFHIKEKRVSPTWHIPLSLREKYEGRKSIPPGPENPLGSHWLGLSIRGYGIHGTNFPWAVGRLVTHGCIRLYPEDIPHLYSTVSIGTPVEIIYEPVKIGFIEGRIFIEVHEDIYHRIPDFFQYTLQKMEKKGIKNLVDLEKIKEAIDQRRGVPIDITSDFDHGR
ncbi:MAG: L,D-transpeptidase family protein [Thermodesulfobacteriota bacterium]|nr:L,D-transpeptidase family protein [Thermodesulfobacteriota bacterium]